MRLFRGASAGERRRRVYGLSWTTEVAEAEFFARERQVWDGGSVVLETLAPPEAIICAVDYPEPVTVAELKRDFPTIPKTDLEGIVERSGQHHHEREYVIDRRYLSAVSVARRYAQTRSHVARVD